MTAKTVSIACQIGHEGLGCSHAGTGTMRYLKRAGWVRAGGGWTCKACYAGEWAQHVSTIKGQRWRQT